MNTAGARIKAAREHREMTQSELARATGLSRQAISQLESGITKKPEPANLFLIADALQYKARYLATGKGPKTLEEAISLSFRKAS